MNVGTIGAQFSFFSRINSINLQLYEEIASCAHKHNNVQSRARVLESKRKNSVFVNAMVQTLFPLLCVQTLSLVWGLFSSFQWAL